MAKNPKAEEPKTEKFEIKSRYDGSVLFTAEVDISLPFGLKLGASVKLAFKARAYLAGANLADANLARAYLADANLADANLAGANLKGANLARANLAGANLTGAYLAGAYLADATIDPLTAARISIVPSDGDYIGWKKCSGNVIVKLLIPAIAKRSNATSRKCRASEVNVLAVFGAEFGVSQHDGITKYRVGATVKCDKWDDNRWNECSGGIHHYISRIEAENH